MRRHLGRIYSKIGAAHATLGDSDSALAAYAEARPCLDRTGRRVTRAKAEILIDTARLYASQGRFQEALRPLQEARFIFERKKFIVSAEGVTLLSSMGDLLLGLNREDKALPVYEQAQEIWQKITGRDVGLADTDVGRILIQKLGEVRTKLGITPVEKDDKGMEDAEEEYISPERARRRRKRLNKQSFRQKAKEWYKWQEKVAAEEKHPTKKAPKSPAKSVAKGGSKPRVSKGRVSRSRSSGGVVISGNRGVLRKSRWSALVSNGKTGAVFDDLA